VPTGPASAGPQAGTAADARLKETGAAGGRRTRRSTEEVRRIILAAAQDMFAEGGYAGTSTRAIARQCGVAEHLIFRHFGNKASLFDAAIRVPFEEFLGEFAETWERGSRTARDIDERSRLYLTGLYEHLLAHRKLLLALVRAAQEDGAEVSALISGASSPLRRYFDRVEYLAGTSMSEVGWPGVDVPVVVRVTFAMVLGMAMCDEWLFPPDEDHPGQQRIVAEMHKFMVHGLAHRNSPSTESPRPPRGEAAGRLPGPSAGPGHHDKVARNGQQGPV
jgi:AcrR family transcriptional regulator